MPAGRCRRSARPSKTRRARGWPPIWPSTVERIDKATAALEPARELRKPPSGRIEVSSTSQVRSTLGDHGIGLNDGVRGKSDMTEVDATDRRSVTLPRVLGRSMRFAWSSAP